LIDENFHIITLDVAVYTPVNSKLLIDVDALTEISYPPVLLPVNLLVVIVAEKLVVSSNVIFNVTGSSCCNPENAYGLPPPHTMLVGLNWIKHMVIPVSEYK
jgi:hypothetical protein